MSDRSDALVAAHLGDNAFADHRDSCSTCTTAVARQRCDDTGRLLDLCDEGERATDRALQLLAAQLVIKERS